MEFHFLFPGLERSWNLTPGFGKVIKVMEIITPETAQFGSSFKSCTSTQGYWYVQQENRNRFNLFHHILLKMTPSHTAYGLLHPPALPRYMSHAISHIKGHWIFSFSHWKVMERPWKNYCSSVDTPCHYLTEFTLVSNC